MSRLLRWLALLVGLLAASAWAQAPQPVPALSARVIDQTATLSDAQRQALEGKLAAFEAQSGPQIVILLVRNTAPEDIAAYAFRVADQWKIGRRGVGDGLLVLVAKDDRVARIEVARALEGAVPDLAARQIIDQAMVPAFRQGDYAGGLNQAVDRLIGRISGEGLPAPAARSQGMGAAALGLPALPSWAWWALLAVPVAISLVRAMLGPGAGALLMGGAGVFGGWWLASLGVGMMAGLVLAVVTALGVGDALRLVLSGAARGGFGGGGGGGFSSGGGGSFGGGGASGRW